jgi:hypothetical protein
MANRIPLGIETDDPKNYQTRLNNREKKVAEAVREDENIEETFQQALIISNMDNADGTVYTGAAGEELGFHTGKNAFECHQAAVATPAVVTPFQSADGLEVKPVAAADALEITNGITALSKAAYTVGSLPGNKAIFFEATVKIDDISDVTELAVGWRKAEAYQAAVDSYDEMASFNIGQDGDGQIEIHTILNNAATAETDTTLTDWADAGEHTLRIEVTNAGVCTFKYDGAAPTVTATFTFDSGEVIVPFLFLDTETGDPGVSVSSWKVGVI